MEFLNKAVDVVLSPALKLVAKHANYLLKAGHAVKSLEDVTKNLLDRRDDVKVKIQNAEREGRAPTREVEGWLKKVEEMETEAVLIVNRYDHRSRCLGHFSLDCCCLYSTGRDASNKLQVVKELFDNGAFNVDDVAIKLPPPLVQEVPTTSSAFLEADPNLRLALHYLRDDKVGMVGIWGMGGVGKTHLLQQVNNSFAGDSTFHTVILVTASKECSVAKIQKEIVKKLGLKTHEDIDSQAAAIYKFLEKKSFLLLLDDLWERLGLQAVGIPFPLGIDSGFNRKAVLTTRSAQVCGHMEVRKLLKVECLKEEEAWTLFVEKVSEETINSDPLIPGLAKQVVNELGGLPLALITIGRSMYTKKNPRAWENAIRQLHKSHLHEIEAPGTDQDTVFRKLKFSYDSLGLDVLQKCFLSCALWPEDYIIGKDKLVRCWIGLGLIVESDMKDAYNAGHTLLDNLLDVSLIEAGNEEEVKMHDVIRDMALWIACDCGKSKSKWVVQAKFGLEETAWIEAWLEAERISLSYNNLERLPLPDTPCPNKLTTLMLQENRLSTLKNISIFTSLAYLDLASNSLDHFPIEICSLINLQYLDLSDNNILSLPEELGTLINLRYLHLSNCRLYMIPEGVIPQLKSLHNLDLYSGGTIFSQNYHPPWLVEELKGLHNLSALGINVEEQSQLERLGELSNVSFLRLDVHGMRNSAILSLSTNFLGSHRIQMNLSTFSISHSSIEEIVFESSHQNPNWHLHYLETLELGDLHCLKDIVWRGLLPKDLFKRLKSIYAYKCDMLENISWVMHLPCLKSLSVDSCDNMKELVKSTTEEEDSSKHMQSIEEGRDQKSVPAFPCLQILKFFFLPQLCRIGDPTLTFPSLELLIVYYCHKLNKLPFQLHNMPGKLKRIECGERWWNDLEWEDANIKSSLQPLCQLV